MSQKGKVAPPIRGDSTHTQSLFVQWIFDRIPENYKNTVLSEKKWAMNREGTAIRMQFYIPNEVYVVLSSFGAFLTGQSDCFTSLACQEIDRRAKQGGMKGPLLLTEDK